MGSESNTIRSKLSEGSCKTEKERDSDPKIMLSGKILGAFLKSLLTIALRS